MVLAPVIEPLAAPSSVTVKPNTPLKTADVPAVACVLQFRISYLCFDSAFGFLFYAGAHPEKHEREFDFRGG